jgi:hypothetical protein
METRHKDVFQSACRSEGDAGCAQCSAAYSCYERRMGRQHLSWPLITLALLLLMGIVSQV